MAQHVMIEIEKVIVVGVCVMQKKEPRMDLV